ncbi:hypothetical protein B0A58_09330 [Flavobacterium branchiophilum NBRC 15030 = ATCC 35035]|uniref:Putative membrane protein n=1 Tax=Flavobacterium branchiophilum TaxID=55197 RepID=A0A543G0K2_9FLAO|nr:phage holin family protein [Flavobacterium branchiophilum]OXA75117.1 hypothetical protein B0A58_09330 [Flavobacterium branchiophilum NBRC 15030 = ATCC 35035]TQM39601.1 putative membrane protein [Flavobacterium branchiophilum]
MKLLARLFITTILVVIIARYVEGVVLLDGIATSAKVALALAILNITVKPLIKLFTLPITFFTLGLFLLVINALMILICTKIVDGFRVDGFSTAFVFSLILSLSQTILFSLLSDKK